MTAARVDHGGEAKTSLAFASELGFPDGHTLTSNGKAQSDSPRYKQLGNAVAVPVFEWVAKRIVAVNASFLSPLDASLHRE